MLKKEMREVAVIYCDYCEKQIKDYSYTTSELTDGSFKHFHSMYTGKSTCLELYLKQRRSG